MSMDIQNLPNGKRDWKKDFNGYGEGIMRIAMHEEPAQSMYIDDILGYVPGTKEDYLEARNELIERINRLGVFGAVLEVLNPATGEFDDLDSIWGFVGDDFYGSGYEPEFYQAGVEAWEAQQQGGKL